MNLFYFLIDIIKEITKVSSLSCGSDTTCICCSTGIKNCTQFCWSSRIWFRFWSEIMCSMLYRLQCMIKIWKLSGKQKTCLESDGHLAETIHPSTWKQWMLSFSSSICSVAMISTGVSWGYITILYQFELLFIFVWPKVCIWCIAFGL